MLFKVGGRLPDRCVKCNGPVCKRITKTMHWHPNVLYLALFMGALPYIVLALATRKSSRIDYGLCKAHATQRLLGFLVGVGGLIGAIVLLLVGVSVDVSALIFIGLITLLIAPLVGAVLATSLIVVKKIDDNYAWFSVGRPFLESLPHASSMGWTQPY